MPPLCPYFGSCGGCAYQDLSYEEELALKEESVRKLFQGTLGLSEDIFRPILASPEDYGYRSRLDLSLRRHRGELQLGFNQEGTRRLVEIDSCAIAKPEISRFLPKLKQLVQEKLPANYRSANLVVKTDDRGSLRWGGIGRGSLELSSEDYLWTEIEEKKIFYSLDTFFQANLRILPLLVRLLRELLELTSETHFLDLYSGVGLFWVVFWEEVKRVWAVEESESSMRLAEFNRAHQLSQHGNDDGQTERITLRQMKTENCFEEISSVLQGENIAALVDPPRGGLGAKVVQGLASQDALPGLQTLVYLSCYPPSLVRDLDNLLKNGWRVECIVPCDLFPKTRHLEVVTRLKR